MKRSLLNPSRRKIIQSLAVAPLSMTVGSIAPPKVKSVVATAELEQLPISHGRVWLTDKYRSGSFIWKAGDFSNRLARDPLSVLYVQSAHKPAVEGAWVREELIATPETIWLPR